MELHVHSCFLFARFSRRDGARSARRRGAINRYSLHWGVFWRKCEEAEQDILKHKLPKTTPYSPLWYKNKLYDVQAMTAKHGLPFLFMTLTVDDVSSTKWTEYTDLEEILKQYHPSLTYQNAPAECALLFHHRFTNFFDSYILGKGTDIHLLGKITHYVVRYEMQSRQAMHAHVCLWVHDDDKSRVASEITQKIPGQYDETSEQFTIPEDPLLAKLHNIILTKNQHTCRKGECFVKGKCRYGYPFKVNHEAKPVLDDENNRYNYYCPRHCDRNTVPYHPMVRLQTFVLFLSLSLTNIKTLNSHIVLLHLQVALFWNAHSNVVRVTDSDLSYYLLKYTTKTEPLGEITITPEMTQLLATHNIPLPLAQSIAAITRSQPVSCQEAVLQMLGIDLIRLSDQVLFLNTPVPRLRKANTLRLHRQGASFKLTNITEYECRPNAPELKNITFVEYFENYEIRKEMRKTGDHEFLGRDTTSGCNFIYKR